MSNLIEFLKLIPKGLPHADKVLEGVVNQVKMKFKSLSEEEQNEIIKRRLICQSCPFNSYLAKESKEYKELTGSNYQPKKDGLHCSFCGCPYETRTASLSSNCGAEEWNNENPNNQIELKWEFV